MKLLILPSHRLLLLAKNHLTLLPQYLKAEQVCMLKTSPSNISNSSNDSNNCNLLAILHYKTITIYNMDSIFQMANEIRLGHQVTKVAPIVEEVMQKKVAVIDLYERTSEGKVYSQCVLSDKFGDLYRLPLNHPHTPIYLNSNLGIPNFIHKIETPKCSYLLLSDEQNRIKIYNASNPNQLLSFWFLINQSSIECEILYLTKQIQYPIIAMLMRYEDKNSLDINIKLYEFIGDNNNMEADQFPGKEVKAYLNYGKDCLFYTMIGCKLNTGAGEGIGKQIPQSSSQCSNNSVVLLFLYGNKIAYELFSWTSENKAGLKSRLVGQVGIEEGKWDYLYGVDGQNGQIIITYGSDVDMAVDISLGESGISLENKQWKSIGLNKYENVIKIVLKA